MMKTAEQIMAKKTVFKAELDKRTSNSNELWKKATEKLDEIMKQYDTLPAGVQTHTHNKIFPSAAIYLTAKEALGEKEAFAVVEGGAIKNCEGIAKKLATLMKIPGFPGLFVKLWNPLTKKIFGPNNGFENTFYPKKKGEYRMDVNSCPYCQYFTELGCPELTRIYCENDIRVYGDLPHLKFERTGTLGTGAERCDFYLKKT